jgi:uncharacterized protein YaiE (UPF0345 family)
MPRNSSGVYTLPAGNPVTTRTIIESSWANNTMSDIANEITESLARNGAGGMTGPMKATDGTAAAPSITFGSETSTGMYRVASGQLGITTGGVQRFNISSSGSTFSVPVTVNGNLTVSGTISGNGSSITSLNASNLSTGTVPDARISQSSVTQHQAALAISASQITSGTLADARLSSNVPLKNVSNTFTALQEVSSSSNPLWQTHDTGNTSVGTLKHIDSGGYVGDISFYSSAHATKPNWVVYNAATRHSFSIGGTEQVYIAASGAVTVKAPTGSDVAFTVNGVAGLYTADIIGQPDGINNAYTFRAKGNTTNNVLATIENTSATGSANLWIAANNFGARIRMLCSPSVGLIGTETSHNLYLRTNWADRISISASGNVTIFAPSSGTTLYVYGDIYATGTITQGSDARMKADVRTIDGALDKVCAMRGVSFTRAGACQRDVGVIAQEVAAVVPEVVREDENGHLSVAYGSMVGVLIEALKELREEVWQLKSKACH